MSSSNSNNIKKTFNPNTQSEKPCLYEIPYDTSNPANRFVPDREETLNLDKESRSKLNKDLLRVIHELVFNQKQQIRMHSNERLGVVPPNNSQVKLKKNEVEDHHRISSISNKTKYVTACNDSLKSRTLNVNAVCATCEKCVFNLNHDACVSKFLNNVNARTKKPKVGTVCTRQPKSQANKSVATPPKKIVAFESTIQKSKSYYRMLYKKTSKA
ncbi:hypothetical protein Tco_1181965 [Tanacetum coccineum]